MSAGDAAVDLGALCCRETCCLRIGERLTCRGKNGFGFGACFNYLALGEILFGVLDGFFQHVFDVGVVKAITWLHFDGVLFPIA